MSPDLGVDASAVAAVAQRYGVARLEVFGSVARGEQNAESDVDLLYELLPGTRLGWLVEDLADDLSAAFGRPVDLVSRAALHPLLRDEILGQAREIYAA